MQVWLPLALALSLLTSVAHAQPAPPPAPPTPEQRVERFRAWCFSAIERSTRYDHLDPEQVDGEAICARLLEKHRAGLPRREVEAAYRAEIRKIRFAWATPGQRHDRSARYRFPFEVWMPRLLSQASGGKTHDTPDQYHAFDFLMPTGTKILAARAGTVVVVSDGTAEGTPWEEDAGNAVTVLHEDGTWATYRHLRAGIPVKVGQVLRRGQHLAFSGNTGFSRTPHLHLVVQRMELNGEVRAVQIRFGRPGQPGQRLEPGHHYGRIPKAKRELRILVQGKRSRAEQPIPIAYGSKPDLRVELVAPDGSTSDVSANQRTRYETMTVWSLHSPAHGQVVIEAVPEIDSEYIEKALPLLNQSEGLLFVYYGLPWEEDFGMARVPFQVLPAAP